jgi:hypothetical protein
VSALAAQQKALLEALFEWPQQAASQRLATHARGLGTRPDRGLKAYQSNGHMLAERVLHAAYPVLAQMLGEASFADLARALWHAHPPQSGDLARWGEALAEFVRSNDQLQDTPYLTDVAQAEWALHRCAFAHDREADLASLELLTTEGPHTLALELAPGLVTLASQWPLASLLLAHLEGTPTLQEVALQLKNGTAQDVVIWRNGLRPMLRQALAGELPLLQNLCAGQNVASALEGSAQLDVAQWLPLAVQSGLVLAVHRIPSSP